MIGCTGHGEEPASVFQCSYMSCLPNPCGPPMSMASPCHLGVNLIGPNVWGLATPLTMKSQSGPRAPVEKRKSRGRRKGMPPPSPAA